MKIKLSNVRLAFPALFEADSEFGKFGAQFIIDPNSPCIKEIEKAIDKVAKDKWGAKSETTLKAIKTGNKCCFYDGDSKADYDGFAGNMALSATNKTRPTLVNKDRSQVTEADGVIYGGCYVNAIVEIWAQDNQYGKRINASLSGVQFVKDGEAFSGGGVASADDFDDIEEGADAEDFV